MKRMVSGLRIEAGEFLTEGYLNVRLEGIENGVFKLTPDNKVIEDMYAYYRPIEWYSQESFDDACYSGYINNIYWQKNDSVQIKLNPSSHNIMFYRKKQTVIKIDYTPEDYESDEYTGNSVAISLEAPDIIVGADYNFTDKNSTVEW